MLSSTTRLAVLALAALIQASRISPSPYEVTISGRVSTIQIPIPQVYTFTTTITQAQATVTHTTAIPESIETTTVVLTGPEPLLTSIVGGISETYSVVPQTDQGPGVVPLVNGNPTYTGTNVIATVTSNVSPASTALAGAASTASGKLSSASSEIASVTSVATSVIVSQVSQAGSSASLASSAIDSKASSLRSIIATATPVVVAPGPKLSSAGTYLSVPICTGANFSRNMSCNPTLNPGMEMLTQNHQQFRVPSQPHPMSVPQRLQLCQQQHLQLQVLHRVLREPSPPQSPQHLPRCPPCNPQLQRLWHLSLASLLLKALQLG